jgi:restriction endonuclease S subunit
MPRADWGYIGSIYLPSPSKFNQQRIANFLDEQVARIDTLIVEKEVLAERLSGYRQSWLSDILLQPKHSRRIRLKFCLAEPLQYGATESGHKEMVGPRYIRITDITADGSLSDDEMKYLTPEEAKSYFLQDRDVLFARSGATVGKSFVYRAHMGTSAFAGYLIRARLNAQLLLAEYLKLVTETHQYWSYLREEETQSTIQNASAEKYANLPLMLPSIEQQKKFLDEVQPKLAESARLLAHIGTHVSRLREYRSSLISSAVTGQLDIGAFKEAA